MERDTVEAMSRVVQILAMCKAYVGENLKPVDPKTYSKVRDYLNDCQEILAIRCDCAPIRLIAGKVDDIMANLVSQEVSENR